MWADTLLHLERGHVLRLGIWSVTSLIVGIGLLVWLRQQKEAAPFVRHFAIQSLVWGAIELAVAMHAWFGLALRDYASAVTLRQVLWLSIGFDVAYVAVALTLILATWPSVRRLSGAGAGVGIAIQGLALLVLHMRFNRLLEF